MKTFFRLVRIAFFRALEHDQFAVAKGGAYSAILTLFPAVLLVASILTTSHSTASFVNEISYALGRILPAGTKQAVQQYFQGNKPRPIGRIIFTAIITLWTGSGVMISWMEGFRKAYHLPKIWGMVRERMIAFMLVVMAGVPMGFASFLVAFGNQIERWMIFHAGHELAGYILGIWTAVRWIISTLTSIAVISLIYHHGLPRTQPWHRVLPGAVFATVMWFVATILFGTYLRHFADYNEIYGSVASAIALLIWLYLVSLVVLVGAEFNALRYPRYLFGAHSEISFAEPREENGR
ncbi:MAG: YihY/virulence factor BrkB family protein [Terriglobia bacterium]|jgi:membrane protein|nr:YihY/virulence factor BrkB family protein [Terriglobia bacterium]